VQDPPGAETWSENIDHAAYHLRSETTTPQKSPRSATWRTGLAWWSLESELRALLRWRIETVK